MLFIQLFLQILLTVVHRVLAALRILLIPTILRLAFWNIRDKIEPIRLSSRLLRNYAHYYESIKRAVFITASKQ